MGSQRAHVAYSDVDFKMTVAERYNNIQRNRMCCLHYLSQPGTSLLFSLLFQPLLAPISTKIAPPKAVESHCINPSDVKRGSSFKSKHITNSSTATRQWWKSSLPAGRFCAWSSVHTGLRLL